MYVRNNDWPRVSFGTHTNTMGILPVNSPHLAKWLSTKSVIRWRSRSTKITVSEVVMNHSYNLGDTAARSTLTSFKGALELETFIHIGNIGNFFLSYNISGQLDSVLICSKSGSNTL